MKLLLIYSLVFTCVQMYLVLRANKPIGIRIIGLIFITPYLLITLKLMILEGFM